jgi:hypothetical protein
MIAANPGLMAANSRMVEVEDVPSTIWEFQMCSPCRKKLCKNFCAFSIKSFDKKSAVW